MRYAIVGGKSIVTETDLNAAEAAKFPFFNVAFSANVVSLNKTGFLTKNVRAL